ncbi:MAG: hypothetical protein JW829_03625 [Pirellulales bacterium]|nr:hypothetical protein [Pirellulales bacterium]
MTENVSRFFVLMFLLGYLGCNDSPSQSTSQHSAVQSAKARQQLLDDLVGKLNTLPKYVNLELHPPRIILDARSSTDGQEILAVCGPSPNGPEGLNNMLTVVTGNAGFQRSEIQQRSRIQSGDLVRYFANLDEDAQEFEIAAYGYFEMPVAQVLDDNRLLVDASLTHPVADPFKLQIWRYVDERTQKIRERLKVYQEFGLYPLHWQPSPDEVILEQIYQGLNQWFARAKPRTGWQADPLLESLPEDLRKSKILQKYISHDALGSLIFEVHESRLLQQAIWMRDIGLWARGDSFDPVARATALFDWTVRNIQLVAQNDQRPPQEPWEVILQGRGTAIERAWVFALLCRHQRIDIVILSPYNPNRTSGTPSENTGFLPALFHEGELYLFDPVLGMPIPGPNGTGIATLEQIQSDDRLFRQLDIDSDNRYSQTQDQWKTATASIVASPLALSHRASILESQLAGKDAFVLTAPTAILAQRLEATGSIQDVRLWDYPFRTLLAKRLLTASQDRTRSGESLKRSRRTHAAIDFCVFALIPELWKARVLHFQGKREKVIDPEHPGLVEEINSHKESLEFYRRARPTARELAQITSTEELKFKTIAKQHAGYWTGLICMDDGKTAVAIDWLKERTLEDWPDGPWTDGARYNLARAYEAIGKLDEAIALYEADTSLQQFGNRLRARQLRSSQLKKKEE